MKSTGINDDDLSIFPSLPPFPSSVPTAPLLRLNLQKLLEGDDAESARLFDACQDLGFFYLDVRGANGDGVDGDAFLDDADQLFGVAEELFKLPVEELNKYDRKAEGSYFGYKGIGEGVTDRKGTKDRNEFYNASKDDILGVSAPLAAPSVLEPHRPLYASYMRTSHAIITLLLTSLSTSLHLPASTLASLHRIHRPSGDQVRFVRSPPQPASDRKAALGAHTDFGSVTLLFNRLGGLKILPPGAKDPDDEDSWVFVRPLRGHCIVNLGDAMVKFSRGVLRSNTHKVANPPGEQENSVRYSLVYFSRPEDDVVLQALEGSDIIDARKAVVPDEPEQERLTSKDWVLRRALGRRGVGEWSQSNGTEAMAAARQAQVA